MDALSQPISSPPYKTSFVLVRSYGLTSLILRKSRSPFRASSSIQHFERIFIYLKKVCLEFHVEVRVSERGINMLFMLGGNGTHAGANAIHNEVKVAVVGVSKTIDNDVLHMDKTFGLDTAVEEAQRAINFAYIEAHSAYHGIGVVKLMGRNSGFIAMQASLASVQVDICLIPEVPFNLHGPHGVLKHLKYLIETKGSTVIVTPQLPSNYRTTVHQVIGMLYALPTIGTHSPSSYRHVGDLTVPWRDSCPSRYMQEKSLSPREILTVPSSIYRKPLCPLEH
ncbi:unnamed protein product [Arabis nemorensis]|uniref:Phosphofructokinase domain-containing protein n=1 Tax=Arabis nemorensis TaxID=586526 RepID=A0A565AXN2_9BRAS|nr:unnamed protein product [Arabis nemorensis]